MVEHTHGKGEVAGSNPALGSLSETREKTIFFRRYRNSQSDSSVLPGLLEKTDNFSLNKA